MRDGIESLLYAPGVIRLHRYLGRDHVEVTCTPPEVPACRAWLLRGDLSAPLPFVEYRQAKWLSPYRWTAAANARYLAGRVAS